MEEVQGHVWEPIELSWGQKLAAFWTIAWPAQLSSIFIALAIGSGWTFEETHRRVWMTVMAAVVYLSGLAVFVPRLVLKRYRSFRIAVERAGGMLGDRLSMREALEVALPVVALQALFLVALSAAFTLLGHAVNPQRLQEYQPLSVWGRILIVGPYSVRLAVAFRYQGFRLRAYALKIAPPNLC
jgi:hypothetical protein